MHEGVVHEGRIRPDHIGDRAERVPRREHDAHVQIADLEPVAIREQPVEIAIRVERARCVIEVRPDPGDVADLRADGGLRAEPVAQPGRRHQVIGMRMGVEDPFDLEPLARDEIEDLLRAVVACARLGRVEILHHVDQRGLAGRRVGHDILDAARGGVVKPGDIGGVGALRRAGVAEHDLLLSPLAFK